MALGAVAIRVALGGLDVLGILKVGILAIFGAEVVDLGARGILKAEEVLILAIRGIFIALEALATRLPLLRPLELDVPSSLLSWLD